MKGYVSIGRPEAAVAERVKEYAKPSFTVIAVLVISTFFSLPLWIGVLGHEGSTVLVVLNGLRLLWEKSPRFGDA